jgi:hypothetical protein
VPVVRVVDGEPHVGPGAAERLARRRVEGELYVLHRGELVGRELLLVEGCARPPPLDDEGDVVLQPDQLVEHAAERGVALHLDEERGAELAVVGQHLVVRVDLVLDLHRVGDALGPAHLFDLKPHGLAVLEDQRDLGADRDPARPLEVDDLTAHLVAGGGVARGA